MGLFVVAIVLLFVGVVVILFVKRQERGSPRRERR
jgi:cbb3-type cytochrome oxidase subunit 3